MGEVRRLKEKKKLITRFVPLYTHSFDENAPFVVFHAQLIADFNTVDELGHRMLEELSGR